MSTELVAVIGIGENPDHMLSPTYLQFDIGHMVEDYELKEWITSL